MIEVKKFTGVLDADGAISEVSSSSHIDARNVVFRGDGDNKRVQNMQGTIQIANSFLPSGNNYRIGAHYDQVRQRLYWLNFNSTDHHGLYYFDTKTSVVVSVFRCFTNSTTDVLNFNLNRPIKSINILYGDDDIFYFLDSLKRPTKINVTQMLLNNPTNVTRLDLAVLKNPPSAPPTVTYINDTTASVNNLHNNLFQFRYRYVYSSYDKSVWSSISKLPLPAGTLFDFIDSDPTKNSRIDVSINTGTADVRKIEIEMRNNLGAVYSTWYLLDTLDKGLLSLPNNATYIYHFLNDSFYSPGDTKENDLLYDYVPDEANAQELLNGNVLIYGGITEGKNKEVSLDMTVSSTAVASPYFFSSVAAWPYNARFTIGVEYYNDEGKTNGVYTSRGSILQTVSYSEGSGQALVPSVNIQINSRPPSWATYYQLVRSRNSTKSWFLEFFSNATSKDAQFAYISMQALELYSSLLPAAGKSVSYEFTAGDRISFLKRINNTGSPNIYTNKDYEIVGVVNSPVLTGGQLAGNFIKIRLPSSLDSSFNFGTVGGVTYNNYLVEVYTPTKAATSEENEPYFEFGERYAIGNPGASNRYHFGQIQNQTPNLSQPATFSILDGDVYSRFRVMGIGNIINYTIAGVTYDQSLGLLQTDFINQSYVDAAYTPQSQLAVRFSSTVIGVTTRIMQLASQPKTFRVRGKLEFSVASGTSATINLFFSFGFFNLVQLDSGVTPRAYLFSPQTFSGGVHSISVDMSVIFPGNTEILLVQIIRGGSVTWTPSNLTVSEEINYFQTVADKNFSDLFESSVNSNGRALAIDDNAKQTYNPALLRWSLAYQQGTSINQTNRFYPENFDVIDLSKGDIEGMKARERILRIFQRRGVARHGVYTRFIKQADGSTGLITSNDIITANNVSYYSGEYGVGNQYTSIVSSTTNDYFVDPVRGYQCRVSDNGIDSISEQWKGQFYIRGLLTPYNKDWIKPNGGISRIHGYFDYLENQYVTVLEGGANGLSSIGSYAFGFQERSVGNPSYTAFFDYYVEGMVCAEETTYSWKNGQLYKHSNPVTNFFHGVQYGAYVAVPFNESQDQKKIFQSLYQVANTAWPCSVIYTDTMSYGTQRQESNLVPQDFKLSLDKWQAAFLRDINSVGGISNGDKMNGGWIVVKFHIANASSFVYLSLVSVKYNLQTTIPR